MKKWLAALVGIGFASSVLAASSGLLKTNHPNNYVVQKGDTLWDISDEFLNDAWKWPEIWQVNPQINNPHLIYPGDLLSLVYVDGQPRIRLKRNSGGVVKLGPTIRTDDLSRAIPAIPLEKIHAFLSKGRFIEQGDLEGKPYVVAGGKRHIISGAGDQLFARGDFDENHASYGIYRKDELFTDPETEEVLGLQMRNIGMGHLVDQQDDIATFELYSSAEEARIGDTLLASDIREVSANYLPSAPSVDISGVIIGVGKGVSQVGKMSVVVINRGERDGLAEGNVLAIMKKGEVVSDRVADEMIQLPDQRAGLLMVFRVFNKLSYGLVLKANQGLSVDDKVVMP
ncbi:LysM domain-containing protein [Sinobacterium caligoides]|uniref:LysM domain-containing protein n=1 Tax=Sinobacterium caligoides TaxID=933926 RepID=A0A3N2DGS6_9GAMM|nr:LysM peptidoglycan-binding domain-containing protein [Sinobacterium caligoides]ROR98990.1 LysM domain-containing protein [Sinobacterium caligoides]